MREARLIVLSFIVAAVAGAVLLGLPGTTVGESLPFVDRFFTAVSAVCVTGLIVVDTSSRFTPLGQGIIVALIQLGGLGIMTLSTVFLLAAGQRISFRDRTIIRNTLSRARDRSVGDFVRYVVGVTLLYEAIGAVLLALLLAWRHGNAWDTALGHGLFLSISAFCNAGFAPWSDSLAGFRQDPWVLGVVMVLVVMGGLGFVVLVNLRTRFEGDETGARQKLTLHTRLVLAATVVMLVVGIGGMLALEWGAGLGGLPPGERTLVGIFQAVTPRTVGFTTIDLQSLTMPGIFLTMVLMMIGAAPGSTGGGLKVTTVAIIWYLARARYRGQERLQVFNRTLPETSVNRALTVAFTGGICVLATMFALLLAERALQPGHSEEFLSVTFEAVSALGNVGLSLGLTEQLSTAGKLIIALAMLAGRVGPLTLALAVARTLSPERVRMAEEDVMVG